MSTPSKISRWPGRLVDAAKQRVLAGGVARAEHLGQHGLIGFRLDQPAGEDRLHLRSEQQRARGPGPVERLDAEAIAHEQETALRGVPDREREHAAEPVHALLAPLFIGVDNGLGVGLRPVGVSVRLELLAHLGVVVDLAVEHHPHRAVLVRQRLLPRAQIDDAETAVREGGLCVAMQPPFVGAPVRDDVAHPHGARRRVLIEPVDCNDSSDSAHD